MLAALCGIHPYLFSTPVLPCDQMLYPWLFGLFLGGGGVGALNRCHLSNWRFNPETVHFLSSKRVFFSQPCLCPNATKQSILAKIHFFTRSQNMEGKLTIFTVLKWGKGRNHYKNHDWGHNHWKRSAKRPKIDPFWTQNVHGFQVRTPIWQMAPISRIYGGEVLNSSQETFLDFWGLYIKNEHSPNSLRGWPLQEIGAIRDENIN